MLTRKSSNKIIGEACILQYPGALLEQLVDELVEEEMEQIRQEINAH